MEFCLEHQWENADEFTVRGRQKDLLITFDANGNEHHLLRGRALERQRLRTPEPKQPEPMRSKSVVEIAAPIVPATVVSNPVQLEEVSEPLPEVIDAIVDNVGADGCGLARITRKFKRKNFAVVRIDEKNVITMGELCEGRLISCRIAPPDAGGTIYNALEIAIYQDLPAQDAEEN